MNETFVIIGFTSYLISFIACSVYPQNQCVCEMYIFLCALPFEHPRVCMCVCVCVREWVGAYVRACMQSYAFACM